MTAPDALKLVGWYEAEPHYNQPNTLLVEIEFELNREPFQDELDEARRLDKANGGVSVVALREDSDKAFALMNVNVLANEVDRINAFLAEVSKEGLRVNGLRGQALEKAESELRAKFDAE